MPKKAIIIGSVVGFLGACIYITILGSEAAIMERFPDVPQKDVVKAHRRMFRAALRGELANVDTDNDTVMDEIFLKHLRAVQNV